MSFQDLCSVERPYSGSIDLGGHRGIERIAGPVVPLERHFANGFIPKIGRNVNF